MPNLALIRLPFRLLPIFLGALQHPDIGHICVYAYMWPYINMYIFTVPKKRTPF